MYSFILKVAKQKYHFIKSSYITLEIKFLVTFIKLYKSNFRDNSANFNDDLNKSFEKLKHFIVILIAFLQFNPSLLPRIKYY